MLTIHRCPWSLRRESLIRTLLAIAVLLQAWGGSCAECIVHHWHGTTHHEHGLRDHAHAPPVTASEGLSLQQPGAPQHDECEHCAANSKWVATQSTVQVTKVRSFALDWSNNQVALVGPSHTAASQAAFGRGPAGPPALAVRSHLAKRVLLI